MTDTAGQGAAGGRVVRAAIWLPGLAVALGAAVATAHGLFEVAVAARVPVGIAWLYPLITDGLALVAYAATARLRGGPARYAWSVVVLAAGLSGLAQATYLAGDATVDASPALRFGVGAWPAIAAAVVAHLLYLLAADHPTTSAPSAPKEPREPGAAVEPTVPASVAELAVGSTAVGHGPRVAERDDDPGPSAAPAPPPEPVQPAVQPAVYSPPAVQPDPYTPVYDATRAALPAATTAAAPPPGDAPDEHPAAQLEQLVQEAERPLNAPVESAPRDRARAAAVRHAAHHGALPTVSELEALAAVSRGTAAAALKALRERPSPLHLVPDTPDPKAQQ